jgi:hypothetical protein
LPSCWTGKVTEAKTPQIADTDNNEMSAADVTTGGKQREQLQQQQELSQESKEYAGISQQEPEREQLQPQRDTETETKLSTNEKTEIEKLKEENLKLKAEIEELKTYKDFREATQSASKILINSRKLRRKADRKKVERLYTELEQRIRKVVLTMSNIEQFINVIEGKKKKYEPYNHIFPVKERQTTQEARQEYLKRLELQREARK